MTMVLISHAITGGAANLTSEKIGGGGSLSELIYETSLTIDTKCKIQCGRYPGDICQSLAVDTGSKWFSSE